MESLNVSVTREEVERFLSIKKINRYCGCLGFDSGDGFGIGCGYKVCSPTPAGIKTCRYD